MNILKGIGAVLAGVVFIVATHSLTDFILEYVGIFTPPSAGFHTTWMLITATIYRSVFSVGGGYVTAALAPEPKMRYVLVLGTIGLIAGTLAAFVTIPMNLSPAWYPIALAVTGPDLCMDRWKMESEESVERLESLESENHPVLRPPLVS